VRYKIRLVAQGFSQKPGVDYEFTYAPVMDSTTFRYVLGLAVEHTLEMKMLDVVTAYLYGPLDTEIYIKPPPEMVREQIPTDAPGRFSGLKLHKALYGLKQAGRQWYKHLHTFLLKEGFQHDQTLPCIFTLRKPQGFAIIAVYVDDINMVGTREVCERAEEILTSRFEMKILGKTAFCLGIQIEHTRDGGVFMHQSTYIQSMLKRFDMDKANPLSTPMVGRSKTQDDPYTPCEEEEEEMHDKGKYLAAVGSLLYLATNTRPDISFAVSVLGRHNQKPGRRHWNGVKHLMRYLRGTEGMGILFTPGGKPETIGYADAGFKSDQSDGKSQTGYIFMKNNGPICWKSVKQNTTATSTNHSELLACFEATREAVWLRTMNGVMSRQTGIEAQSYPTVIYEDNAACVAQMQDGFIKTDGTKHIPPQVIGYTQDQIRNKAIQIKKIESAQNVADVLTKALPAHTHHRLIKKAGLRMLSELKF